MRSINKIYMYTIHLLGRAPHYWVGWWHVCHCICMKLLCVCHFIVVMDALNVLLLCVSSVSLLGWHAKGTRFDAYYRHFFFPLRLYAGLANWRSPVRIHLGARGTFFPNFFSLNFFFHAALTTIMKIIFYQFMSIPNEDIALNGLSIFFLALHLTVNYCVKCNLFQWRIMFRSFEFI